MKTRLCWVRPQRTRSRTRFPRKAVRLRPGSTDGQGVPYVNLQNEDKEPHAGTLDADGAPVALPISEAARAAGISERVLRKRVNRETVASVRITRNRQEVAGIEVAELLRHYPEATVPGGSVPPDPKNETGSDPADPGPDPGRTRKDPEVGPQDDPSTPPVGEGSSTALVASIHLPVEVFSELRSRADRTAMAERALEEERMERRATLAALVTSQEKVRALLESPDALPARPDRRLTYAIAGVALMGFLALGWRLHSMDDAVVVLAGERDAVTSELNEAVGESRQLRGETNTLREGLRDERQRVDELSLQVADAKRETEEIRKRAAGAVALDVALRAMMGE